MFKQRTADEMRMSDWSSDVCSSERPGRVGFEVPPAAAAALARGELVEAIALLRAANPQLRLKNARDAVEHVRRGALTTAEQTVQTVQSESQPAVPTLVAVDSDSRGWPKVMPVGVFGVSGMWVRGWTEERCVGHTCGRS